MNIYIGDVGNHRIRMVSQGVITTVAGVGFPGNGGDGGPADRAEPDFPRGLAVDPQQSVYIRGGK
jgi:hypothetical protein